MLWKTSLIFPRINGLIVSSLSHSSPLEMLSNPVNLPCGTKCWREFNIFWSGYFAFVLFIIIVIIIIINIIIIWLSSSFHYHNIAETDLCRRGLRVQNPNFTVYCDYLLALFTCRDLLGAEEEYIFFSSSSAWESKELAMEITSLNSDFLGESNYM